MELKIKNLTGAEGLEYLNWVYEEAYDFYNTPREYIGEALLGIEENLENWYAAYLDGELIGVYEYNFFGPDFVEMGLGLKPSYTGRGKGYDFVSQGLEFLEEKYGFYGHILFRVKQENLRAINLYKKLGFKESTREMVKSYNREVVFIHMIRQARH